MTREMMESLIAEYVDLIERARNIGRTILDVTTDDQWDEYKEIEEIECLDDQLSLSIDHFDRCG